MYPAKLTVFHFKFSGIFHHWLIENTSVSIALLLLGYPLLKMSPVGVLVSWYFLSASPVSYPFTVGK